MEKLVTNFLVLLAMTGAVYCSGSNEDNSKESVTPPAFLQYKVKALNTALYYILQALQDDLIEGEEVDISFIKRIYIIITKIKAFYGKVDETNALMLGELRRTLPEYLQTKMALAGFSFDEYTDVTASDPQYSSNMQQY